MPTRVIILSDFEKDVKHLRRKYPAVTGEVLKLISQLENDDRPGDKIPNIGYDVYKVRLTNPSAGRGKSGGFRVIYYIQVVDRIYLLTIYSKTEFSDKSPEEIRRILQNLLSNPPDDKDE